MIDNICAFSYSVYCGWAQHIGMPNTYAGDQLNVVLCMLKNQYRNRLPWLTEGLKLSIKHKNKLYRTSSKHPTEYNVSIYKNYRNKLTSLLKIEEKNFYQNQITSNKNNLRKVWAIIKYVINKNKSKKKSDQFISNNNNKKNQTNPNEIANGFNDYFVNIGPTLAANQRRTFL